MLRMIPQRHAYLNTPLSKVRFKSAIDATVRKGAVSSMKKMMRGKPINVD